MSEYIIKTISKTIPWTKELIKKSPWISIKKQLPLSDDNFIKSFVLAYHTVYGVGTAWFYILNKDIVQDLEDQFQDRYICSCDFIKNKYDGNCQIDFEDSIDIFLHSPDFRNLGTVTHWMPLPEPPELESSEKTEQYS